MIKPKTECLTLDRFCIKKKKVLMNFSLLLFLLLFNKIYLCIHNLYISTWK